MAKLRWSNEDLKVAVQESQTWTAVLKKLCLEYRSSANMKRIKQRASDMGFDSSHFTLKSWGLPELQKALESAKSWSDVLKSLGLTATHGNGARAVKRFAKKHGLQGPPEKGAPQFGPRIAELFVVGEDRHNGTLKKRLRKEGLLPDVCALCGQGPEWKGQPLVLQLDHINGNRKDNRMENLRILCPNCHTQTETFGARRFKKPKWKPARKSQAGIPQPWNCKVERPSKEDLEKMVWEMPTTYIAKQYEVSDQAVAKWCKTYGISKPPRGYWQKLFVTGA